MSASEFVCSDKKLSSAGFEFAQSSRNRFPFCCGSHLGQDASQVEI
jgi:hypothetical protein